MYSWFGTSLELFDQIFNDKEKYNKWKLANCFKEALKRKHSVNFSNYGIKAKISKKMSKIKSKAIKHNLVCIVTLIKNNGQDKYDEFIKALKLNN